MNRLRTLVFSLSATALLGAATPEHVARLLPERTSAIARPASPEDEKRIATIQARPDPQTFFNRYVFALQRERDKLLSPAQASSLDDVIARYAPLRTRWHDERNVLRCKFNEVQWRYASASGEAAPARRNELARWMELRMEWTLREQLLYYEQDAAAWALLDASQRQHLLAGDWKAFAKMTTGHERENATAKLITKALGPPDHPDAFARAVEQWREERAPLHRQLMKAENDARRVGFAMDVNSPALMEIVTRRANDAYATVYLAEADAYRRLIRTGYDHPAEKCAQAATESWSEAPKRFTAGAADLIEALKPDPSKP